MGARKLCTPCPQLIIDRNMGVRKGVVGPGPAGGYVHICGQMHWYLSVLRPGRWVCPGAFSLVLVSTLHAELCRICKSVRCRSVHCVCSTCV